MLEKVSMESQVIRKMEEMEGRCMMVRIKNKLFFLGSLLTIFIMFFNAPYVFGACSSGVGNWDICPPPIPLPKLPPAGEKFTDPTFGTEIIRVTDEKDGQNVYSAYSYWNLFNVDSTRFFILIDETVILYNFDKYKDTISKVGPLFPGQPKLVFQGTIWSAKDPDILFGTSGAKIYKYNVVTHRYTVIKDFSSMWPGTYLWQMSMSEDDNVFAFTVKRSSDYSNLSAAWYRISTDTYGRWDTSMDECQVDKGGSYLFVHKGNAGGVIWNIISSDKTALNWNSTDHPPSHYDQGYGKIVSGDPWSEKGFTYIIRSLSDPQNYRIIFVGNNWGVDSHISWRNNDDQYMYISNYAVDQLTNAPLENEIIQIFLDGSKRFRRLAHHRSFYKSYWDSPRASVDRLGKYIIFSSNWDNSSRRDVFILKIPGDFQSKD